MQFDFDISWRNLAIGWCILQVLSAAGYIFIYKGLCFCSIAQLAYATWIPFVFLVGGMGMLASQIARESE